MQRRIHELAAHAEKQKYDSQEQLEIFKSKYNDYKTKLKKANLSIQTLTTRLAKQELQIQAEREIGRVDSVRMGGIAGTNFGSDLSAAQVVAGLGQQRVYAHGQVKSNGSALSPAVFGNENFNIADYNNDFENQELNEEIKKLLQENI